MFGQKVLGKVVNNVKNIGQKVITGAKIIGESGGLINRVRQALSLIPDLERFVGATKVLIEKYSENTIKHITSCKTPLSEALQKLVKGLYNGKQSLDTFFHLFLRLTLDNGTEVIFEKNERPMMSMAGAKKADEQQRVISTTGTLKLGDMITRGIQKVGLHKYFVYDPFYQNCQHFQIANLSASPAEIHFTEEDRKWIDQDAPEIAKGIPNVAKSASAEIIQAFGKLAGRLGGR